MGWNPGGNRQKFGWAPCQINSTWTPGGLHESRWIPGRMTRNLWGSVKSSSFDQQYNLNWKIIACLEIVYEILDNLEDIEITLWKRRTYLTSFPHHSILLKLLENIAKNCRQSLSPQALTLLLSLPPTTQTLKSYSPMTNPHT